MTTTAASTAFTPAEIDRLSDETGKLYELIDGQLVEKTPMSMLSNWVAGRILHLLSRAYPESEAYVFAEQPVYCFGSPREMRRPDVALVWANRMPKGLNHKELRIVPDLVVEVVSPSNHWDEIEVHLEEYLSAGVPMVWVVGTVQRRVYVYRKDGTLARLRENETLKDEPLMPGLELRVADFFPAAKTPPAGQ